MLTQKVTATRRSATIKNFSFSQMLLQIKRGRNLNRHYRIFKDYFYVLTNKLQKMLDIHGRSCMNEYFLTVSTLSEKIDRQTNR
jgi:5-carboxymethyl-2-hydroxymuconate isomerase